MRTVESSADYLAKRHPAVHASFFEGMRAAVDAAGPLDDRTRELIMLAGYVVAGQPRAFQVHLRRALAAGASPEAVRHAVLVTLGASATLEQVVDALRWIDRGLAEQESVS